METASAKFDLSLSLAEQLGADGTPGGLAGVLEYASDLFERASVEAIADRLIRLLEAAVAQPDRPIGSLEILAPAERHRILREWNDTARAVPRATLPQLFAAQVARTPDAVAALFEQHSLSYRALDARSSQLAHHLRAHGVGPEVVVGLCIERSLEMLIGLLGILKAGGAYLPLDPDYPPERLAFMLADARAPLLVTTTALRARLPDTERPRHLPRCRGRQHRRAPHLRTRKQHSARTTPPMSSTHQAQQERQKASSSIMPALPIRFSR